MTSLLSLADAELAQMFATTAFMRPRATEAFDGSVSLPVAGYNYNSDWTPCMGLLLSRSFSRAALPLASFVSFLFDLKARFFVPTRHRCKPRAQEVSRLVASSPSTRRAWP
jgi:hypothetical protein